MEDAAGHHHISMASAHFFSSPCFRPLLQDVFAIVRDALREMEPDTAEETLQFYSRLVEDFFGLPPRAYVEVRQLF